MIFGRIRLLEWRFRVEKTAKSAGSRANSRRGVEANLNDFVYHEQRARRAEKYGKSRALGACGGMVVSTERLGFGEFEAKSGLSVKAKVTLFLLPPDGVC